MFKGQNSSKIIFTSADKCSIILLNQFIKEKQGGKQKQKDG